MEIVVAEQVVRVLRIDMTEEQARSVLVDPTEFQNALRGKLAEAHAAAEKSTALR